MTTCSSLHCILLFFFISVWSLPCVVQTTEIPNNEIGSSPWNDRHYDNNQGDDDEGLSFTMTTTTTTRRTIEAKEKIHFVMKSLQQQTHQLSQSHHDHDHGTTVTTTHLRRRANTEQIQHENSLNTNHHNGIHSRIEQAQQYQRYLDLFESSNNKDASSSSSSPFTSSNDRPTRGGGPRRASVGHWFLSMAPLICIFACMMLSCPCRQLTRYTRASERIHHGTATGNNNDADIDELPTMTQNKTKRLQLIEDSLVTKMYTRPSKHDTNRTTTVTTNNNNNQINIIILEKQQEQQQQKQSQDQNGENNKRLGKGGRVVMEEENNNLDDKDNMHESSLYANAAANSLSMDDIAPSTSSTSLQQTTKVSTTPHTSDTDDTINYSMGGDDDDNSGYCRDGNDYDHDECQICLDSFQINDKISWSTVSKCNHTFHHDCITEWLKRHTTCPTCRDNFLFHKQSALLQLQQQHQEHHHQQQQQQQSDTEEEQGENSNGGSDLMIANIRNTIDNHNNSNNNSNEDDAGSSSENQNETTVP